MTEQDFINKLAEIGYNQEEINSIIDVVKKIKTTFPNITFKDMLPFAVEAHKNSENEPKDVWRFDSH